MSQQNIELAKAGYAAFGRGDIPGLLSLLDAGIEWKTPGLRTFRRQATGAVTRKSASSFVC